MIGRLIGILAQKQPPQVLVDVQGVGYEIDVPMSTFYQLPAVGERVALHTHLVVREDAHQLYGFVTEAERGTFRQLLKITGVGARTALAVLSGLSVSELVEAVVRAGDGPPHEDPRHRQEDRRAPAAGAQGQDGHRADAGRAGPRSAPAERRAARADRAGLQRARSAWARSRLSRRGSSVAEGIRQALKSLSKA